MFVHLWAIPFRKGNLRILKDQPHDRGKQLYQFQIRNIENNRTASLIMLRNKLNCTIKYALEQIKMLNLIYIGTYETAPINMVLNR